MSRRRRGLLLAGLALLLGGLAASDVAGREAALDRRLGPSVEVVVAREALSAGERLTAARLAVRRVPARFAPRAGFGAPAPAAPGGPARPPPLRPARRLRRARRPRRPARPRGRSRRCRHRRRRARR